MPAYTATQTTPRTESEPDYAGPHRWQIGAAAKTVRRIMRWYAYTRWVDRYCDPLVVRGVENLQALDGPAIFVANHQSHMDSLVLFDAMPERVKRNLYFGAAADRWFVNGKKKLVLQPWYQSLVLGNFPIVRGGGAKALEYARWLLQRGCNVCIFPEGTRTMKDELGRFKPGVAILALELGVPVVPVYLSGLRQMRPKGALHAKAGPAGVDVFAPVTFTAGTTVEDATAALRKILADRHNEERIAIAAAASFDHAA
ncbi:MAG TPA: lysophospholipid acyltransferase family protein [Pseudomonadales bacterium]